MCSSNTLDKKQTLIWQYLINAHLHVLILKIIANTVEGFIFVGTNLPGLKENDTFAGFKICGHSTCIFLHNLYRKSQICGYWNSWIGPSTKTTKIGTSRKLSHPQYTMDFSLPAYCISVSLPQGANVLKSCTSYTFPWMTTHRPPSLLWFSRSAFRIICTSSEVFWVYFSSV